MGAVRDLRAQLEQPVLFRPHCRSDLFDPANGICPTDAHVRVAIGLDSLGAAPIRGMRYGQGGESLAVAVKVGQ